MADNVKVKAPFVLHPGDRHVVRFPHSPLSYDAYRAGTAASPAVCVLGAAGRAAALGYELREMPAANSRLISSCQSLHHLFGRRLHRFQKVKNECSGVEQLIDIQQGRGRTGFSEFLTALRHRCLTMFFQPRQQQFVFAGGAAQDHAADIACWIALGLHRCGHGADLKSSASPADHSVIANDRATIERARSLRTAADDVPPRSNTNKVLYHSRSSKNGGRR